jgi:hypothetical protein
LFFNIFGNILVTPNIRFRAIRCVRKAGLSPVRSDHVSRRNVTIAAIGEICCGTISVDFHRLFCLNMLRMPPSPAPGRRRRRAGLDANPKQPHGWKPPGPVWPNCRSGFRCRRRTSSPPRSCAGCAGTRWRHAAAGWGGCAGAVSVARSGLSLQAVAGHQTAADPARGDPVLAGHGRLAAAFDDDSGDD